MTQQEKAKELINKMYIFSSGDSGKDDLTKANARQCALIAVEEILRNDMINSSNWQVAYWQEVKQEINQI